MDKDYLWHLAGALGLVVSLTAASYTITLENKLCSKLDSDQLERVFKETKKCGISYFFQKEDPPIKEPEYQYGGWPPAL